MFNTTFIHKAAFVRNYKIARATGLKPKQAFSYAKANINLQIIKAL
jgi:hypothetical protein